MSARGKRIPPALKHGGYSATAPLPGEDPAAFKKLHDALIAEFSPVGALEEDIVASIARLVWRKRQLARLQVVEPQPHKSISAMIADGDLRADLDPDEAKNNWEAFSNEIKEKIDRGEDDNPAGISRFDTPQEARRKYDAFMNEREQKRFVNSGEITTLEQFMSVLAVEERLDTMIDRCLKRLLFLRGLKSLVPVKSSSQPSAQKRLRSV
jgi:hypothetical protein